MLSRLLPLVVLGCVAVTLPGCLHEDQDRVVANAAQELAGLPRDVYAQSMLNAPKPKVGLPVAGKQPQEKLQLPPTLPGYDAAPIVVPPLDPKKIQDPERDKKIQALYPGFPPIDDAFRPQPGPGGQPLDLPALEQMAIANNPLIQQAAADVQAARGAAIQAGLYPNPVVGFEGDSIGQAGTNGSLGGFCDQIIKTCGKLELARGAGMMEVRINELGVRRSQFDVMTQVRTNYFGVLVAQENLAIAKAMADLSDEVYRLQVKMVQGGQAAAYEPLQLHVLAYQARGNLVQAHNRYLAAWRGLAAALGQPSLPPTLLAGRADVIVPNYGYDTVRDFMLANHTDLGIASTGILKARLVLELAKVTPIPDVLTHLVVQNDHTAEPNRVMVGVQVGVALPVWDRNQGGILQAQALLAKANRDVARVENDLAQKLADAYERYRNNVTLASYYRDSILPNQVRVYRGIYQRYQQQPDKVSYNDIVVAQQTLAQALQTYVQTMGAQWQAVVDLAALMQTDDIYQLLLPSGPCVPPQSVSQMLDTRTWNIAEAGQAPAAAPPTGNVQPPAPQAQGQSSAPARTKLLPPTAMR